MSARDSFIALNPKLPVVCKPNGTLKFINLGGSNSVFVAGLTVKSAGDREIVFFNEAQPQLWLHLDDPEVSKVQRRVLAEDSYETFTQSAKSAETEAVTTASWINHVLNRSATEFLSENTYTLELTHEQNMLPDEYFRAKLKGPGTFINLDFVITTFTIHWSSFIPKDDPHRRLLHDSFRAHSIRQKRARKRQLVHA